MSGTVINLRQARKQNKRRDKEKLAEQNRVSFGRTKLDKTLSNGAVERLNKGLDQKKLEGRKPTGH